MRRRLLVLLPLLAVLVAPTTNRPVPAQAFDYAHLTKLQKRLLSGLADLELRGRPAALRARQRLGAFSPHDGDGCGSRWGANVRVNQNCMSISDGDLPGRGQAANEPSIAQDPNAPAHLVASFNDYRGGEGTCATAYSRDGGKTWADSAVPVNFTRGTAYGTARQYWQTGGDGTVAFDSRGNAYLACQRFQRGTGDSSNPDLSSGIYVFRSTGSGGASWNFPGRPVIESPDVTGTGAPPFEDKPVLTVDNNPASPYRDRIYVTYSEFSFATGILTYESHSDDFGEHFSPRVLVFNSGAACPNSFFGPGGDCDAGVDGQPFTGVDGVLYVVQNNFNNFFYDANDNHNQVLLARSIDGGQSFTAPVKVADYYDLPDCATYQRGMAPGRSCVPEKNASTATSVFRAINYATGAANPQDPRQVVVAFGSYINPHSNESTGCFPAYFAGDALNTYNGVKSPGGCNNDILLSVSNDGGLTFDGATTDPRQLPSVTAGNEQAASDQFWQWAAFTRDGTLAVSFYDRQYGNDESTGFSDVSLSLVTTADRNRSTSDRSRSSITRLTSTSMAPPTQFEGTFYGDYAGLAAGTGIHAAWSDTRDPELFICPGNLTTSGPSVCTGSAPNGGPANNQEIFTATR